MAARQDIINLEAARTEPATWNQIHLFKEGSFWHAFEWSAWLICVLTYNNEKHKQAKDSEPIAVIHRHIGGKKNPTGSYTMVGFQMRSVDKYIPNRTKFETIDDKHILVEIELPHQEGTSLTYELLHNAFEKWKSEQPFSKSDDDEEDKQQKPQSKQPHHQPPTVLTDVESQLLAWPVEQYSPIETMMFVAELKQKLSAIFKQEKDN